MRERPILFSGEMVRAILGGKKTQTRRVVKPQPSAGWSQDRSWVDENENAENSTCPYGLPGDRLWVRETWRGGQEGGPQKDQFERGSVFFRADEEWNTKAGWRPSIFLPRWASRITLEIISVRVQRLQEIDEKDSEAEGVSPVSTFKADDLDAGFVQATASNKGHQIGFRALWDSINAKQGREWKTRAHSWDANPWVWALTFKRVHA